ncbi:uncharacterized protein LOC141880477 isoform X2 [Acropora palmata]|uniref:uncharacterized protein LOC141880477 isoform X2 n=1 Tax=Acropora palmata TaxID=6131 RepID=UPI003DA1C63D
MNQFNAASNWKLAWTVNIIKKGNAEELLVAFIGNTLLTERLIFVDHYVNPQIKRGDKWPLATRP